MARILICDDAEFIRIIIRDALENAGHQVVGEAGGVEEALTLYKRFKPDIVTMDLLMSTSGVDAVREIIKHDPKAKIIIISVLSEQEDAVVSAVKLGAMGLVTKPIKRDILISEIERVLNK